MIYNFPKNYPIQNLSEFTFGNVEGKFDDLLSDPMCICIIDPVHDIINGRASIIIGDRGAGKSAIFRLITDKKIKFKSSSNLNHIIVPVDDELNYRAIKQHVGSVVKSKIDDDGLIFRVVWEVYLIYKILVTIKDYFHGKISDEIKNSIQDYEDLFGKKKKTSFYDFIQSNKKTIGVKLDSSATGMTIPNFYFQIEPSHNQSGLDNDEPLRTINIDDYKIKIQKFLEINKSVVYVLIDRLDEFVVKEEYDVQKEVMQGLLEVERCYQEYNNINIKLFIRSDLFKKLDFDSLGYDKIISRKVDIIWQKSDIRLFIAKRIIHNLSKQLNLKNINFSFDEEKLYLDETRSNYFDYKNNFITKIFKIFKKLVQFKSFDARTGKNISFNDEISRQIITTIFPRYIEHFNENGKKVKIDIFQFFDTHFCLGHGHTTPRIILIFLQKCIDNAKIYYKNNPIEKVVLDENNEYPLLTRNVILNSYCEFRRDLYDSFSKSCSKWESSFNILNSKKGNKSSFTYKDLKKIIVCVDELEFRQFLAYLNHIGFLYCQNANMDYEERKYTLPVLFR